MDRRSCLVDTLIKEQGVFVDVCFEHARQDHEQRLLSIMSNTYQVPKECVQKLAGCYDQLDPYIFGGNLGLCQ